MSEEEARKPAGAGEREWGFAGATLVALLLVVAGHGTGEMLSDWPPQIALRRLVAGDPSGALSLAGGLLGEMKLTDWLLAVFLVLAALFVVHQRRAVVGFFRSFRVGVTLVLLSTLAVMIGVLVPQIEGFEDPEVRVDLEREHEKAQLLMEHGAIPAAARNQHTQYEAYRWAEGYFLWNLLHLYGVGRGKAEPLSAGLEEQLEALGRRYGPEEQENRRKRYLSGARQRVDNPEIGAWIREHEDLLWRSFRIATLLELNRTYKSSWFASLLILLFLSILTNTLRTPPWRWLSLDKAGTILSHLGMMVLLVGGLVSNMATDRGILQLDLDDPEPQDTYWRHFDPRKASRMPFGVKLDHFARRDWKALEVLFPDAPRGLSVPRFTLWEGREIDLDFREGEAGVLRPALRLRVLALHEQARVGAPRASERPLLPGGTPVPLAELEIRDPGGVETAFLSPGGPIADLYDPDGAFRLRSLFTPSDDDGDPAAEMPAEEGILGQLLVELEGSGVGQAGYELREGATIEVAGGFRLEVVRATTNFRFGGPGEGEVVDERPLAEQPHTMPAVVLDVHPPDGGPPERRVLLDAYDPVEFGQQADFEHPELVVRLRWDRWSSPGPPRYLLRWSESGRGELVAGDGSAQPVVLGSPLSLPGEVPVVPLGLLANGRVERDIDYTAPRAGLAGWDAGFYARSPRGLELEVIRFPDTARESRSIAIMATTREGGAELWRPEDGRFVLHYLENDESMPFEWRSELSIHERDAGGGWRPVDVGTERQREIRVNDYFQHRGYRFFQTNADARFPSYSGVGVVYDPGIPLVLIGMWAVIAGGAVAFLVKPIARARRREEVEA